MQKLYRYKLEIARKGGRSDDDRARMMVIVSFYRRHVDSGYREMLIPRFEAGEFDEFICCMLQGLLSQGE